MTRWSSTSRLAPEGAPRSHSSTEDFELRAALEESSTRRAELTQKLREARGHLDAQTDLLKTTGSQLQHSQSISNVLDMKHKQLSEAVSALEQDKEAAELSRFEESRRRGELHDKVLQLELDMLKMRSDLERRSPASSPNPLSRTLPAAKDQTLREEQRQAEKEMKKLREALRKAEERTDELEYEKESALRQLRSSEELKLQLMYKTEAEVSRFDLKSTQTFTQRKHEAINQAEELEQSLSSSIQTQKELEDQLNESRSRLGQMELEKDLFSTKTQRLEDNLSDLKIKLSGALMDKDRLVQEKAELHQRVQALDLQLQREQRSRQGFSEQVCELHAELSHAKSQNDKQKMETMLMKEELLSIKELNEKLSSDLTKATERLQVTLNQLHELEAEKLIQTNQIAALDTERLQLIGEKEELRKTFDDGLHEKMIELGERCCQHRYFFFGSDPSYFFHIYRELQDNLEQENQALHLKCQDLEKKVQISEAGYKHKEEEQQQMRAEFEQEKEELRKLAAHWNERWLDVAMTLCSTQTELNELKSQQQVNDKVMSKVVDGELVQVKDMLRIRDTELEEQLEEQLEELRSAHHQESQQSSEVQRLEQLLAKRDQEIKEKDQDLKNLEIQRIRQKAEAQIKISALEQEIFGHKGLLSRKEVVSESSPEDLESLKALLKESRRRAETLEQERDRALHKLQDLEAPRQGKTEKESPLETKKHKPTASDLVDPDQQRRLVTEQLKSLFRERERCGERSPVFTRRSGLVDSRVQNATSTKTWNALDTLNHQGRKTQKLEQELQQGAAKRSSSQISVSQEGIKEFGERGGEETAHQSEEPQQNNQAKVISLQPNLQQDKLPLGCSDGTFLARQVELCDPDLEYSEGSI
ncbi:myosin-9-like [Carassius gibelio]|uniref:myosin-9-like n=1 Tax=Carassius gibelio TaxID=101364 RepID=UPI00227808E3|nr:myosin-9-like [Carassius gibelio]